MLSRAPLPPTSGNRSPSTPPGDGWCPPSPLGLLDILVFLKASGQTGIKKLFMSLATSVCLSRTSLVKVPLIPLVPLLPGGTSFTVKKEKLTLLSFSQLC